MLKLTEWTSCGGCAAKWGASPLDALVKTLAGPVDEALLVGLAPFDDAAVYRVSDDLAVVATTDFFGFDTSDDHYGLQGHGFVSEMGDAVLGLVTKRMKSVGKPTPRWLAVRNVSDPQIKAEGTIQDQAHVAAQIYKGYGRWSTVCSAIVCVQVACPPLAGHEAYAV